MVFLGIFSRVLPAVCKDRSQKQCLIPNNTTLPTESAELVNTEKQMMKGQGHIDHHSFILQRHPADS